MSNPSLKSAEAERRRQFAPWVGWAVLIGATLLAYANSLQGPFILDDVASITENPSITTLWPPWHPLFPPAFLTVTGRPIANLTLAINQALGGGNPVGYHCVNLLIHLGAGLLLAALLRRTLELPAFAPRFGPLAPFVAFMAALLWLLHPLQTGAVTYVIQRVEALMALFYLGTLYGFVRAVQEAPRSRWLIFSAGACLLGMGTKEVMVSAPLIVMLFDRSFVVGSFRAAWQARRTYYLVLAGTWLWLCWLVWAADGRGASAGFGEGTSTWRYLLTQCDAIVEYLRLAVWPSPLIFDRGGRLVRDIGEVWPQALMVITLLVSTVWLVIRRSGVGFLGACFFAILAPSSSIVPVVTQTVAEHRMYLPLAAVLTLLVALVARWGGRRSLLAGVGVAVAFGVMTANRNRDYRSADAIWRDTLAKDSGNVRALNALGNLRIDAGDLPGAADFFAQAIAKDPSYVEAYNNLGTVLQRKGHTAEAVAAFTRAIEIQPNYAAARFNLGNLHSEAGRTAQAIAQYREVLRLNPGHGETLLLLGALEMRAGEMREAESRFRELIRMSPSHLAAHFHLGYLLSGVGRHAEAVAVMRAAMEQHPQSAWAAYNLGNALAQAGRLGEAVAPYQTAVRLEPRFAAAHFNLANTFALLQRYADAVMHYEHVLAIEPNHTAARRAKEEAQRLSAQR